MRVNSSMTSHTRWLRRRELLAAAGVAALGSTPLSAHLPAQAAGPPPTSSSPGRVPIPPTPDLANLYDTIHWIGKQNEPGLSFLGSRWKDLEEWKQQARPTFHRCLDYYPKPEPLSAELINRERRDGFTLEAVKIRATAAYQIPAWVLIPDNLKGRVPGLVAIHDHGGAYVWGHEKIISYPGENPALTEYRNTYYGRPYAELLARKGYVVLVIDGFYFGERRLRPEEIDVATAPGEMRQGLQKLSTTKTNSREWISAVNQLCHQYESLTAKTIFTAGATWPGILVWDDMCSVDYLCSRPEVDATRIGCLGLSIGGLRTAYLIAADPRIKVACVTGWMTEFEAQLRNYLRSHTWMVYIPGLYSSLDLPDAASMTAPGALLVQQCDRDELYPADGMKRAVEKLNKIYAKAGIPDRFRGLFYDVGHSFRPGMQDDAFAWIEKWI